MTNLMVTGTRKGMTPEQLERFEKLIRVELEAPGPHEWRDGNCIGADEQANAVVAFMDPGVRRIGYPSNVLKSQANCTFHEIHPAQPPIERNHQMVDSSDLVFACPSGRTEQLRGSGTWATIRYAKKVGKHLIIIWPDGKIKIFND